MGEESGVSLLKLRILTPEGSILEGEVSEVTLPGSEGEMGVLPRHAACLTRLVPGRLSYRSPEGDDAVALGVGAAEIREDQVTVIVERAVLREDIDSAALQLSRKKILAALEGGGTDEEDAARLQKELTLSDIQLQVAREGSPD